MEGFKTSDQGPLNIKKGSDGFLSKEPEEEIHPIEFSREMIERLPSNMGLDGKEFDEIIPGNHRLKKEIGDEIIEGLEAISPESEKVKKDVLLVLTDAIRQGALEGWDTKNDKPLDAFIEVQGATLEKAVKERAKGWREDCAVYELLREETLPSLSGREKNIGVALLKRASRSCAH